MTRSVFFLLAFLFVTQLSRAQSPFVPLNQDYYHLIDRLEIRQGRWAEGFHSTVKPYNRHSIMQLVDSVEANPDYPLSDTDYFNLGYLRDDSWEWATPAPRPGLPGSATATVGNSPVGNSRKPFLNTFYRKKADFYSVQTADFDLHINPVIHFGAGRESAQDAGLFTNTRGLEVRGSIGRKLGFYTFFSDNQAVFPRYLQEYGRIYGTGEGAGFAPGEGLAKRYRQAGADYLTARGYITFNILKIINFQFGHDRNFFGNGYRSLLLSDNSAPNLFVKFSTRFGKHFQYTNLFSEMQNRQVIATGYDLWPQKFVATHHLSANIGQHINLGVFESTVFSRDRLDLNYLNPIILFRFVESFRGSRDNALVGLDFKANFLRRFLFYSQLALDEFLISALREGNGSWTNKFGVQAGLKYIDAFGVQNLDLQGELNLARPYTYSHRSGQTNYVHYNQPLAHPLGANFIESIGIARYQHKRLTATGTLAVMRYGTDPPGRNYGGNILLSYDERVRDNGNYIGQGRETIVTSTDLRLTYMLRHNFFLEGRYLYRFQDSQYRPASYTSSLFNAGLRWNIPYRSWTL